MEVGVVIIPVVTLDMSTASGFWGDSRLWEAKHSHAALPELWVCVIFGSFAQVLGLFGDGVNAAIAFLASSFLPPGSAS